MKISYFKWLKQDKKLLDDGEDGDSVEVWANI